ncbi:MAG TPA: hypothetical protein VF160_10875 [Candidatus Dormibacteraeota bacterium]
MDENGSVLLRLPADYEGWLAYVFDPPPIEPEYWFWGGDYEQQLIPAASRTLVNVHRLFGSSSELVGRFSTKQMDEGFWRIVHFLSDWLNSPHLGLGLRLETVGLVPTMFEESLGDVACDTCYTAFMWWDCLRFFDRPPKTPELLPEMRKAMLTMLASRKASVVASAVHGLGHLVGDRGDEAARDALMSFRTAAAAELSAELVKELDDAIEGRTH